MLILGLLLLLAAGALTAGMLLGNTGSVAIDVYGYEVTVFSMGELFALGVATGVIAGLSLALVLSGMRRASRKRRERRADLKTKRSRELELQEENARLARELDQQRRDAPAGSAPPQAPGGPGRSDAPGGPDRTQPISGAGGFGSPPPAGMPGGGAGFERPGSPPSQAPASSTDVSQEGRRPLS